MTTVPAEVAEKAKQIAEKAMIAGDCDGAIRAVRDAFKAARKGRPGQLTLDDSIAKVLTSQIARILKAGGVLTIGDLIKFTPQELVRIHQVRWKSIDIIQRQLEPHGFKLSQNKC